MYYGPLSYYQLGRTYPRSRTREPFVQETMNRRHKVTAALFRVSVPPSTIPVSVNPARLLRDDWIGSDGQQALGLELYVLFTEVPVLKSLASQVPVADWDNLDTAASQLYTLFSTVSSFRREAPRVMRETWRTGKMFSEELYLLFKSVK